MSNWYTRSKKANRSKTALRDVKEIAKEVRSSYRGESFTDLSTKFWSKVEEIYSTEELRNNLSLSDAIYDIFGSEVEPVWGKL